jgi:salicylate hydroxylase
VKSSASGRQRPRVVVAGAGIGGLTLAAVLSRIGVPCEVFEQARSFTEVGAGVQLAPNAVRPLLRLGIGPELRRHAVRIAVTEVRSWQDHPITRTEIGDDCERRFAAPYYTVHRAHLHAALCAAADRATLRLGQRLVGVEERGTAARAVFADGLTRSADLVVGADGIHSVARNALSSDRPVFSGLGAFRGLVPASRLPSAAKEQVVRIWLGPGKHVVCYPVTGGQQVSFAAITPLPGPAAAGREHLRAAFANWRGLVPRIIEAADIVHVLPLHDRDPLPRWVAGRITVLGDAAHPMLPFLAQGANQAIEDAMDLAACLVICEGDVPAALARYQAMRVPRTTEIQRQSRARAVALHLADGAGQRDRDHALGRASSLDDRAWLYDYRAGMVTIP